MSELLPIADLEMAGDLWRWIVAAWVFAVGAAIGSFLNVVIYRVPAGLSIAHPPSHCPACKHPIRPYDNIPIVSYLLLSGRCRDCGARFSSRYAIVELVAGLMLVAIAATGPLLRYRSLGQMLGDSQAIAVWGEVAFLAVFLATLWSVAMIARDGHRPPRNLILVPLLVGHLCGMLWPSLHAIPIGSMLPNTDWLRSVHPIWTGPLGALVGTVSVALWYSIADRRVQQTLDNPCPMNWALAWAAVAGLFLGWQMALLSTAIAAAMMTIALLATVRRSASAKSTRVAWLSRFTLAVTLVALQRDGWPWLFRLFPFAWILAAISVILFGAVLTALVAKAKSPQSAR